MFNAISSNGTIALLLFTTSTQLIASVSPQTDNDMSGGQYYCVELEDENEILCDVNDGETLPAFTASPLIYDAIQIDIRPKNCTSFFDDYLHTRRGLRIESALELALEYQHYQSTVTTFPVIDFISNGDLRVVKTRDLTANSFQTPDSNALYKQIINDAEDIQERFLNRLAQEGSVNATVNGSTSTIANQDVGNITLDIVIQSGIASMQHATEIERAKQEILQKWGFKLRVIEIP